MYDSSSAVIRKKGGRKWKVHYGAKLFITILDLVPLF